MKYTFLSLTLLVVSAMSVATNALAASAKGKPAVAVTATRVEGLDQAEGIDCPRPRFSWQLDASVPNVIHFHYCCC